MFNRVKFNTKNCKTMEVTKCKRNRRVFGIIKLTLQAATLVTAALAVHELDRIHHRLKKIERRGRV